jgi:hypothetical protein
VKPRGLHAIGGVAALAVAAGLAAGCATSRPASPRRLAVEGVLRATSQPPPPGPYIRALVLYTYDVAAVLEGTYPHPRIQVYHWAILNRRFVPEIVDRKRGQRYRLVVEPFDDHPSLAREDRTETHLDFDLPLFMDMSLGLKPK